MEQEKFLQRLEWVLSDKWAWHEAMIEWIDVRQQLTQSNTKAFLEALQRKVSNRNGRSRRSRPTLDKTLLPSSYLL